MGVLTFFDDGTESGVAIFELASWNVSIDSASSIWSIEVEASGDGMTLALSDYTGASLWTEEGSFPTAQPTVGPTTGPDGGNAASAMSVLGALSTVLAVMGMFV